MSIKTLLSDIMRILTPIEVNNLTSLSKGGKKVALTLALEKEVEGIEINITSYGFIEFSDEEDDGSEQDHEAVTGNGVFAGPEVQEYISHFIIKVALNSELQSPNAEAIETSSFILKEKERFKYVHNKLKGKEVFNLYEKSNVVDLEMERKNRKDLSKSAHAGVLVNKKHY